jgi:hypothetical protein
LNDLLPFKVGRSHDSFYIAECQGYDVILLQHCQQAIQVCARQHGVQKGGTLKQTWVAINKFIFVCPWPMGDLRDKLKKAEIHMYWTAATLSSVNLS